MVIVYILLRFHSVLLDLIWFVNRQTLHASWGDMTRHFLTTPAAEALIGRSLYSPYGSPATNCARFPLRHLFLSLPWRIRCVVWLLYQPNVPGWLCKELFFLMNSDFWNCCWFAPLRCVRRLFRNVALPGIPEPVAPMYATCRDLRLILNEFGLWTSKSNGEALMRTSRHMPHQRAYA